MSRAGSAGAGMVILIWLIFIIAMGSGWVMNIYKLTQCDFEAPYKAELIRTVGIIPIVGAVTGWLDIGEENGPVVKAVIPEKK